MKVQGISKRYQLGLTHTGSVRELVNGALGRVFRRKESGAALPGARTGPVEDHIWALRDVSFEVNPGEAIGIIGRNGAGKSTLLKIMSRITKPTQGRIEFSGRVASLLEVGTGFHPELTGRENVYMNGTILGMTKKEIRQQFDSIIAFAEVEKFIDTPVKRYSSGMTVRLGFAVAAHLNPEILIVDEVLAVGDVEFQKQCLGKMDEIAKSGRTVLFVSHNMESIRQLTSKAILIEDGRLVFHGETTEALDRYQGFSRERANDPSLVATLKRPKRAGDQRVSFVSAKFIHLPTTKQEKFEVEFAVKAATVEQIRIGIIIFSSDGAPLAGGYSDVFDVSQPGVMENIEVSMGNPGLAPGHYWCAIRILTRKMGLLDAVNEILHFDLTDQVLINSKMKNWYKGFGSVQLDLSVENQ